MYSSMKYNWNHFTATDYDAKTQTNAIYKFLGRDKKGWSKDVDDELGNYDYLCVSQPWDISDERMHQLRVCQDVRRRRLFSARGQR